MPNGNISHPVLGNIGFVVSDGDGGSTPTRGPRKPQTVEQNGVIDLATLLAKNPNTLAIAADLTLLPSAEQAKLAELCFNLIGLWAEWADVVGPEHPLWNEYLTSKRMVEGLFDNVNSGGKHRASA